MGTISVSPHCLACGGDPDDPNRCQPQPARQKEVKWFREQPGFELQENLVTGHVVAVGRDDEGEAPTPA